MLDSLTPHHARMPFSVSWYAAWSSPCHATLLDLLYLTLRCLTLPTSCYAAWSSLYWMMLCYLVLSSWLYVFMMLHWMIFSIPHATLLDPPYIMLVSSSSPNHVVKLVDLAFMMHAAWSSLCLILSISCYAIWSGLRRAKLLDGLYLMLRCWTFPTSCQPALRPLYHVYHVKLFDLNFKMLHCSTFSTSC